ncbi:MAG: glycerophosphodiester phosphodiesterase [Planctomycetota bacterium]
MLIISHRGRGLGHRDNTLDGFRAVAAHKAPNDGDQGVRSIDGIETDIRVSATGDLILFHDRHTSDGTAVRELTLPELCEKVGYRVPTLPEALALDLDVHWYLEIKAPEAEPLLRSVITAFPQLRSTVISFHHPSIFRLARANTVDCGVTFYHDQQSFDSFVEARAENGRLNTLVWGFEFLNPAALETASSFGFQNLVYDAITPTEQLRCLELGVEGVIIDTPHLLSGAEASDEAESPRRKTPSKKARDRDQTAGSATRLKS